jgi:8-oxo-dGTP pyrophosphatase MutT (NUDIX family)
MAMTPHKATTVVLVRENISKGFEVFLVRRHDDSAFMGGNYVYPGGRVDPADQSTDVLSFSRGLSPEKASEILGNSPPDESIGNWIAGIRELFEEAGILLAYDSGGKILSWVNRIGQEKLLHYRESLHRKDLSLSHLAQEEKIFFALDQLHYYAHWITPEARSIRFDTRFFVAFHPSGQEASHDQRETTHGLWITPRRALEGNSEKRIILSPPTLITLEDLSRFTSVDDLMKSLHEKKTSPILPILIKGPPQTFIVFPWDPDYAAFERKEIHGVIDHGNPSKPGDKTTRVILKEGCWCPYCRT